MIPTTTGFKDAIVWKGFDNPDVKGGRVMDMEAVRGSDGSIYSRWKTESWRERVRFLFTGRLWIGVMAERLPPVSCVIGPKLALFLALAICGCAHRSDITFEREQRRAADRSLSGRLAAVEDRLETIHDDVNLTVDQQAYLECGCGNVKLDTCPDREIKETIACLKNAMTDLKMRPAVRLKLKWAIRHLRTRLQNRALDRLTDGE